MFLTIGPTTTINMNFVSSIQGLDKEVRVYMKNGTHIDIPLSSKKAVERAIQDVNFYVAEKPVIKVFSYTINSSSYKNTIIRAFYRNGIRTGIAVNKNNITNEDSYVLESYSTFGTSYRVYTIKEDSIGQPVVEISDKEGFIYGSELMTDVTSSTIITDIGI